LYNYNSQDLIIFLIIFQTAEYKSSIIEQLEKFGHEEMKEEYHSITSPKQKQVKENSKSNLELRDSSIKNEENLILYQKKRGIKFKLLLFLKHTKILGKRLDISNM